MSENQHREICNWRSVVHDAFSQWQKQSIMDGYIKKLEWIQRDIHVRVDKVFESRHVYCDALLLTRHRQTTTQIIVRTMQNNAPSIGMGWIDAQTLHRKDIQSTRGYASLVRKNKIARDDIRSQPPPPQSGSIPLKIRHICICIQYIYSKEMHSHSLDQTHNREIGTKTRSNANDLWFRSNVLMHFIIIRSFRFMMDHDWTLIVEMHGINRGIFFVEMSMHPSISTQDKDLTVKQQLLHQSSNKSREKKAKNRVKKN